MRPAFDALFDLDEAMAAVVVRATQPALAAIKLAWWRDRLTGLDAGESPAEPRLRAAAKWLLPNGIAGIDLAGLAEGWSAALDEQPDVETVLGRGAVLFRLGGRLLGSDADLDEAGRLYAAGQLWRLDLSPARQSRPGRYPPRARPLTALAALAARDVSRAPEREAEATPGRAWTILRHRWTGRIA